MTTATTAKTLAPGLFGRRCIPRLLTVGLAALSLAACGGGGGGGGGAANRQAGSQEEILAYENGYQQCTGFSVQDLAATYDADKPNKDAVAEAVARSNPGQPELHDSTKKGCLDAIEGKPFKPSGKHGPNQ